VGYNGRVFFRFGIQWRRFPYVVGYNRIGCFPLWDTTENNPRMANKFCSIVSHNAVNFSSVVSYTSTESCAVYCIPEKSSALFPTTPQVFLRCIKIQWKIFSSVVRYNGRGFFFVVGYNGRSFPPLWDTTEEVFSIVGYNGRDFFRCGIQWKKNIQRRMIFLNFKCLSLPSNKNFGKISYMNSKTNPWKELKMENYRVNHKKKFVFHCEIQRSRDFFNFELK
jgi:hypothetical protein